MRKDDKIVVKSSELPLPVIVIGDNGELESYRLMPASRKFGASLQKDEHSTGSMNHGQLARRTK